MDDDLPDDIAEAVRTLLRDNDDLDEETAIAMCRTLQKRDLLDEFLENGPQSPRAETHALAQFRNPGRIERVEEGGGVTYKRICLLAPGVWTDAGSRETILYSGEGIRNSADNWDDNQVNLLHGPALHNATSLGDIGEIRTDSIIVDDEDRMFGDVHLHGDTPASELGIELMDEALETGGDQGIDGPSVEIVDDDVAYDDERGMSVMSRMVYSGIGLVFNPASRPVDLSEQMRERAIAMADAMGVDEGGIVIRANSDGDSKDNGGQTLNTRLRHAGAMGSSERERVMKLLGQIGTAIEETQRVLADEGKMGAVQDLIAQYLEQGGDPSESVSEFVSWMEENTDLSQADVQDVFDAYLEAADAESLEQTPIENMAEWLQQATGGAGEEGEGEGEGEGQEGEEGEGEQTMSEDDLRDAVNTIGSFADELETVKDMLSEREDKIDDRLGDLERRLSSVEDEPVRKSLSEPSEGEFVDAEGGDETPHEDVLL